MLKTCHYCLFKYPKFQIKVCVSVRQKHKINAKLKHVNKGRPIINCKRPEYNFYAEDYNLSKFEDIKLVTKGWHHAKSKGDYFVYHQMEENDQFDYERSFKSFGLRDELINSLEKQEMKHPSIIQSKAFEVLLRQQNALIAAETGCGKTLAYLIPMMQQILDRKSQNIGNNLFNSPSCLVLTPSRELAFQIEDVAQKFAWDLNFNTDVIVGGGTKKKMLNPTFKEVDLLVATPGALSKLVTTGIYKMCEVKHVVLDEADTLLDDSFAEKLSHFLKKFSFHYSGDGETSLGTQLTLVSATMPKQLPELLTEIILLDSFKRVTTEQLHRPLPHVPQKFLRVTKTLRPQKLLQLVKLDVEKKSPVIIFSNKSATCDWISMFLNENNIKCENLNGNIPLVLRKSKFSSFQSGKFDVISCTDIGSRGLDTTKVKHVLNFDFPMFIVDYIHRCGRIGRIGSAANCRVTNFIASYHEIELVKKIEMGIRKGEELPNVNGNIPNILHRNFLKKELQSM